MKDIFIVLGIIIGILIIRFSKNTERKKLVKGLGILIILVCIAMAIPDFAKGFMEGVSDASKH